MLYHRSTITSLLATTIAIACNKITLTPVQAFAMHGNQHQNRHEVRQSKGWGPKPLTATIDDTSTDTAESCVKTANILSLDSIRSTLIRQEETIIFAFIERAQYRQNNIIYKSGGFGDLGIPLGCDPKKMSGIKQPLSLFDFMMIGTVSYFYEVNG